MSQFRNQSIGFFAGLKVFHTAIVENAMVYSAHALLVV